MKRAWRKYISPRPWIVISLKKRATLPSRESCTGISFQIKNIAKPSFAGRNESLRWNGHLCKEKAETYYLYFIWHCKACQAPTFSVSAIRLQIRKWVQKWVRQVSKKPWNRVISRLFAGGGRWIRTTEVIDSRFTVCPLWPLGNSPIFTLLYSFWNPAKRFQNEEEKGDCGYGAFRFCGKRNGASVFRRWSW